MECGNIYFSSGCRRYLEQFHMFGAALNARFDQRWVRTQFDFKMRPVWG